MPKMRGDEPAHRTRPVQVAKRKRKPLGQEEMAVKKKAKITKAATAEEDEVSPALDAQEEPKMFISPEKYLDKAEMRDEDEEPPRVGSETCKKRKGDKESTIRPSDDKSSSSQRPPHIEKSKEPSVDRFVTSAQEDLMQMIEERASDKAIENQLKIIKMLRARLPSQDEPRSSSARKQLSKSIQHDIQTKSPIKDVSEPSKRSKATSAPRHSMSISSDSSFSSFYSSPTPSPAPSKRLTRTSIAKAKAAREIKENLKTAFPASAPTSLPSTQRTNKSLTTKEVAKLSKVHTTFDGAETNKFDRHTRKINSTRGMASDRPVMPERGLESRIRAPTESPPEVPRNNRTVNELRLDAGNLRVASSAAASEHHFPGRKFTSIHQPAKGKFTSTNQPVRGKVNTSLRGLEESVRTMNALLTAGQILSGSTVTPGGGQPGQCGKGGQPGRVYNAVANRWQYVEELDSDGD